MKRYTEPGEGILAVNWAEGETAEAMKMLQRYENTGMTPEEVERLKRDVKKYQGAGLRYEAEIEQLKQQKEKVSRKWERMVGIAAELTEANHNAWKMRKREPKAEWILWALSFVAVGLSVLDVSVKPLRTIYCGVMAIYWTVEIWRRWGA